MSVKSGNKTTSLFIIAATVLACAAMAVVDGVIEPPYAVKSAVKLVLFICIPLAYSFTKRGSSLRSWFMPRGAGKHLLFALAAGAAIYVLIVGGYFALRGVFDFSAVTASLADGEGVTRDNFIYVAAYISVINSLCEEIMFRAFAFGALADLVGRRFAYIFSSAAFAVYHVAIMKGWFSPLLMALLLFGLFVGALIFDRVDAIDDEGGVIYPSWIVHMCANLGINTVGLILFGII